MKYKNTYLASNGKGLEEISYEEYRAIMANNANQSNEKKRFFIKDEILESNYIDRMYIEVSYEDYSKWHADQQRQYDHGAFDPNIEIVSLDASIDLQDATIHDYAAAEDDTEKTAVTNWIVEKLYDAAREWAPWGEDMLMLLLLGEFRACNRFLTDKYRLEGRALYRCKQEFRQFIQKTYKSLAV